ncbi:TrbI/VirB10 family protein [Roseobacter sp. OBYS 0001]|uniref:TrbI/VirB10 family protein n=1 Tax=Roseobacter sp. OBYS 0001 TaxID=882651 RepID=UPI00217F8E43|nr:TrbI/VirB10 family protein [Roseobacter sp. OBYS 0001]
MLFATQSPTVPSGFAAPSLAAPGGFITPQSGGGAQTDQDSQLAFFNAAVNRRIFAPDRVTQPAPPYVLQAGSIIPAALVTGIRSDVPGQIVAQVTQNIYDSPSGRYLLQPQGSRLIGEYDNGVGFGQHRILLVWTRTILPDGQSIVLERQPGADSTGYAGLEDGVDHHWGGVLRAALLSTLLNIGAELGADDDNPMATAIRDGGLDTIGDAGREIVCRQNDISPTLMIWPGFPVRVIVTRDLILDPQGEH